MTAPTPLKLPHSGPSAALCLKLKIPLAQQFADACARAGVNRQSVLTAAVKRFIRQQQRTRKSQEA